MAKKLKTGDVRRIKIGDAYIDGHKWAVVSQNEGMRWGAHSRSMARLYRWDRLNERIARILSIGPKYVTVRISK